MGRVFQKNPIQTKLNSRINCKTSILNNQMRIKHLFFKVDINEEI